MFEQQHKAPEGLGVYPDLHLGPVAIPVYGIAMLLAIVTGLLVYRYNANKVGVRSGESWPVVLAAVLGGILGAKIPLWLMYLYIGLSTRQWSWMMIVQGRTIVGGLIGGMVGVLVVKQISLLSRIRGLIRVRGERLGCDIKLFRRLLAFGNRRIFW